MDSVKDKNKKNKNEKGTNTRIPKKAGMGVAVIALVLALFTFMMVIPFSFVFSYKGSEVYSQESVRVMTNFEKAARDDEGTSGWAKVYGEDNLNFKTLDGDKYCYFEDNYGEVKRLMIRTALKNLFTFSWDQESFVIVFTAE